MNFKHIWLVIEYRCPDISSKNSKNKISRKPLTKIEVFDTREGAIDFLMDLSAGNDLNLTCEDIKKKFKESSSNSNSNSNSGSGSELSYICLYPRGKDMFTSDYYVELRKESIISYM